VLLQQVVEPLFGERLRGYRSWFENRHWVIWEFIGEIMIFEMCHFCFFSRGFFLLTWLWTGASSSFFFSVGRVAFSQKTMVVRRFLVSLVLGASIGIESGGRRASLLLRLQVFVLNTDSLDQSVASFEFSELSRVPVRLVLS
jgi:hypothetical protein